MEANHTTSVVRWDLQDKVAVIVIDNPPVNAGSSAVRSGLFYAITEIATLEGIEAAVLIGAGKTFIAGSDMKEFDKPLAKPEAPAVIEAIESCPVPVVAAIHAVSLGGGFEYALGCDARIAKADALVGLPEVTLGLIPGAGGTQRLPRLVGIARSIEIITSGRRVGATEALTIGAIDAIVDGDLRSEAVTFARGLKGKKRHLGSATVPAEDPAEIEKAAASAIRAGKGLAAVSAAIEAVRMAASIPFPEALQKERAIFQALRFGSESKALRHLFFAEREAARMPAGVQPRKTSTIGVIGLGTMGRGIATAFALAGLDVLISEADTARLAEGRNGIQTILEGMERKSQLSAAQHQAALGCLRPVTDLAAMAGADVIVEAVIEDLAVKRDLFRTLEACVPPDTILASNTSYLHIDAIAAGRAHPGRVAGLHFFSPAHVMRLIEVVRGTDTSADTLATLVALARRLGKLPVQAKSSEGFIGNRILMAYRAQCEFMIEEGALPHEVDAALKEFGMAMGPFAVSDLSGLDIAWRNRQRLAPLRKPGERYVEIADRLCEAGRLGRKTGAGWYRYTDGRTPEVDPAVTAIVEAASAVKGIARRRVSEKEIIDRALAVMINEACLLLGEEVTDRPADVDLVMVNGYGFPAGKGGPLYWAAGQPRGAILRMIDLMAESSGPVVRRPVNLMEILDRAGVAG